MSKYKFNDYTLPGLPEGLNPITYPYQVIIHGTGVDDPANGFKFWLVGSGEAFTALNVDGTYCVAIKPYTVVHQFLYIRGEEEWVWEDKGTLVVEDMDSTTMENLLYYYFNPTNTEYIWCNEDIKDTSGNVVFEGSEPVLVEEDPEEPEEPAPTFDKRSFWLGVSLGLSGKGLPQSKQPTFYLYNGVKLPPLPEWDREMYPYAAIQDYTNSNSAGWRLYLVAGDAQYNYEGVIAKFGGESVLYSGYTMLVGEKTWKKAEEYQGASLLLNDRLMWSNFDVLNEDGSVYLAASEPVPVYE